MGTLRKYRTPIIVLVLLLLLTGTFFLGRYLAPKDTPPPPIKEVKSLSVDDLIVAMRAVGLHNPSTTQVETIIKVVEKAQKGEEEPKASGTAKTPEEADKAAQAVANKDGADGLLKYNKKFGYDPKTGKLYSNEDAAPSLQPIYGWQYFGVKKEEIVVSGKAISVYADPDSYGVGYRASRTQVDLGRKWEDGSLTTRIHYDIIQRK